MTEVCLSEPVLLLIVGFAVTVGAVTGLGIAAHLFARGRDRG